MIDSDRRPVSNRRSLLKSVSNDVIITVRFKSLLKSAPFPNSHIYDGLNLLLSNRRPFQS